jgi:hypothetical protein
VTETQKPRMTMDRAARRYSQIAKLERDINVTDAQIAEALQHVKDAKQVVSELREKRSTLLLDLRAAARDEGELPLVTLMEMDE